MARRVSRKKMSDTDLVERRKSVTNDWFPDDCNAHGKARCNRNLSQIVDSQSTPKSIDIWTPAGWYAYGNGFWLIWTLSGRQYRIMRISMLDSTSASIKIFAWAGGIHGKGDLLKRQVNFARTCEGWSMRMNLGNRKCLIFAWHIRGSSFSITLTMSWTFSWICPTMQA